MLILTKLEAAERQLHQAIRLHFEGGDPVSIHTLAEAAGQLLWDTRSKYDGRSFARSASSIREDKKKEWFALMAKHKNFFKHADKDPDAVIEFNVSINHFSLHDAVNMLSKARGRWSPETYAYNLWFVLNYPHLLKEGTEDRRDAERLAQSKEGIANWSSDHWLVLIDRLETGETEISGLAFK